jgi:hypothetical protein
VVATPTPPCDRAAEWRDESHPAKGRPIAATSGRTQKNNCSRAAGVNDALAAEVIQVDVSLACYAGVEMVAAIKRTCAQADTIRQTIEATTLA